MQMERRVRTLARTRWCMAWLQYEAGCAVRHTSRTRRADALRSPRPGGLTAFALLSHDAAIVLSQRASSAKAAKPPTQGRGRKDRRLLRFCELYSNRQYPE